MKILITGAAGFIGSRFSKFAHDAGYELVLLDNFSRPRSRDTGFYIKSKLGLDIAEIDIRDSANVLKLFSSNRDISTIWHLAGQVSYQESIKNPVNDFMTNAVGTLNLLDASRSLHQLNAFIYSSSNKVYGELEQIQLRQIDERYHPVDFGNGFAEDLEIKPAGPYGISKYSAELLCKEYSEIFGIPTIVFRQSSISGERQLATDDQGWVSYFCEKFALNENYFFTGNGFQVRDILHVRDLFDLFLTASQTNVGFDTYNVGGGIDNSISIQELLSILISLTGNDPDFKVEKLRSKDQLFFVSNNSKVHSDYNWSPQIPKTQIVEELVVWFQKGAK